MKYYITLLFLMMFYTSDAEFKLNPKCPEDCQIGSFLEQNGLKSLERKSFSKLVFDEKENVGYVLVDLKEHVDNERFYYQKVFIFPFNEHSDLMTESVEEYDIFIDGKARIDDFVGLASDFYFQNKKLKKINGVLVAQNFGGVDPRMFSFKKQDSRYYEILDKRNQTKRKQKDCYTAWYGYYDQFGVFIPVYAIYTWCTNGNGGGSGSGNNGGQQSSWPKTCTEDRLLTWNGAFGSSYHSEVIARLTKLSAGHYPNVTVSHQPFGSNIYTGVIRLSVTGGYIGNGSADARAVLTHSLTVAGTTVSQDYGPKVMIFNYPGNCY